MAHAQISMFHTSQNANLWAHFVWAIVQRHVDLLKESWVSVKTWIIKYCRWFLKNIDISGSIGPKKSLKTGKFSLAQASEMEICYWCTRYLWIIFVTIKVLFSHMPIAICSSRN